MPMRVVLSVGDFPAYVVSLVKQLQFVKLNSYSILLPDLFASLQNTEMRPFLETIRAKKLFFYLFTSNNGDWPAFRCKSNSQAIDVFSGQFKSLKKKGDSWLV